MPAFELMVNFTLAILQGVADIISGTAIFYFYALICLGMVFQMVKIFLPR